MPRSGQPDIVLAITAIVGLKPDLQDFQKFFFAFFAPSR